MSLQTGKLIVIDGIDGSGKTTQIELLKEYLASQGVAWEAISFPRYGDNLYGKLIRRYLEGEFGGIEKVNPYLMALAFAGDRALAKPLIENWLNQGKVVLANRYVSSSKAHLSANLPEDQREEFMEWIDQLEYQTNNLPKPELTILLNVDPKLGQQNVVGQENVKGENLPDLHEDNIKHLEEAGKIFLELAQAEPNWRIVECMKGDKMQTREQIHQQITALLREILR